MQLSIMGEGSFQACKIELKDGESFITESGAMAQMSANIDYEVTTHTMGGGGGLLAGLKRMVTGNSFFMSHYTARGDGHIVVAPSLLGNIHLLDLDGTNAWVCTGGSYLGSSTTVEVNTQFQGMRGMFSGESLSYLELTGRGSAILNGFGHIRTVDVDGEHIIDTGHVIAFEDSLTYKISKAGGSWIQSFFAGEGLVFRFNGKGKVLVQSHNPTEFGKSVGPKLPPR